MHTQPTSIYTQPTPIHTQPTPIHTQPTPIHTQPTPIHTKQHLYTHYQHLCTHNQHLCTHNQHLCTQPTLMHVQTTTHLFKLLASSDWYLVISSCNLSALPFSSTFLSSVEKSLLSASAMASQSCDFCGRFAATSRARAMSCGVSCHLNGAIL